MEKETTWTAQLEALCRAFSGQCGLVIMDSAGEELLSRNTHEPFSAASLIKLPMLYHYGLLVQSGELDERQRLLLRESEKAPGFGVLRDLAPGCFLTVNDLVTLMIILSDNTATNMMIDLLGIESVNETADLLGLSDTRLWRKMYDWEAQQRGVENMTTTQDMAALLLALWQGDHLEPEMRQHLLAILSRQRYRNKLPALVPDPERWAHKTGELDDADHDVGFLLLDDGDDAVIVALLTRDGTGRQERVYLANQIGKVVYGQFAAPDQR